MWRALGFASLGGWVVVLLCELLLRLLPVATSTHAGYYIDPLIRTYPAHHQWRVATGWDLRNHQTVRANNLGFVDDVEAVPNPDAIALIGDSYVEASMLPPGQRPVAQLRKALGDRRVVYAMGSPGTSLLDYAERIRYASEHLGVRDFVLFLEAGDMRQALCGSGNIDGPCLDRRTFAPATESHPPASALTRVLRESALAQYLNSQLRVDPARLWQQLQPWQSPSPEPALAKAANASPARQPMQADPLADIDAVTNAFFRRIEPFAPRRLVLVVDARHAGGALADARMTLERARFMALARARGASVVDMAPIYQAHHEQSSLALDVGPYDGHLNRLGVHLFANAAASGFQLALVK
jgi:hypothetical protein